MNNAQRKEKLFYAAIALVEKLTGMKAPDIKVAPPEVFKEFHEHVEKVAAIYSECESIEYIKNLRSTFKKCLDAQNKQARLEREFNNAQDNFSSSTIEAKRLTEAIIAASLAENEARVVLSNVPESLQELLG